MRCEAVPVRLLVDVELVIAVVALVHGSSAWDLSVAERAERHADRDHREQNDAERVEVRCRSTVRSSFQKFGCHVPGCSKAGRVRSAPIRPFDAHSEAEVRDLDREVFADEHVLQLEVPVADALPVHVGHRGEHLLEQPLGHTLGEGASRTSKEVKQLALRDQLRRKIVTLYCNTVFDPLNSEACTYEFQYVGVVKSLERRYFLHDVIVQHVPPRVSCLEDFESARCSVGLRGEDHISCCTAPEWWRSTGSEWADIAIGCNSWFYHLYFVGKFCYSLLINY